MELYKFFLARNPKNRKEETRKHFKKKGNISPDNSSQGAFWGRGEMSQSKTDIPVVTTGCACMSVHATLLRNLQIIRISMGKNSLIQVREKTVVSETYKYKKIKFKKAYLT